MISEIYDPNKSEDLMHSQDLAMNAITGGKHKPQNQSGLGGLASSLLGGGNNKPSQGSSGSGGLGGIAGQLVGSMFAEKPSAQQQQASQSSGGYGGSSNGGQQGGGGLMSFLGGHHGSSVSIKSHRHGVQG